MHLYKPMTREEFEEKTKFPRVTHYKSGSRIWHLIYDHKTRRPIASCRNISTINFLLPHLTGVSPWYNATQMVNKSKKLKINNSFNPRTCWLFQYDIKKDVFNLASTKLKFNDAYKYAVLQEKAGTIDFINDRINEYRLRFSQDLKFQTEIDSIVVAEANEVVKMFESGETINVEKFPLLDQMSKLSGNDMYTTAMELLLKTNFNKDFLVQTEIIRIRYSHATLKCKEMVEVRATLQDFADETRTWPVI